jgi:hypothetical protein
MSGLGFTLSWDLGYSEFSMSGSEGSDQPPQSASLEDLCGKPCSTLQGVGESSVIFSGVAFSLTAAAVGLCCAVLMGCIDLDSWGGLILGVSNTACFCSFLGSLLMVCGVAAVVNGEGDEYRFTLLGDPDKFHAAYGSICAWVSIVFYVVGSFLLRTASSAPARPAAGRGGGGKGVSSPSFKFGGAAMRPAAKPGKQHGKRPSGFSAKKKGGYL